MLTEYLRTTERIGPSESPQIEVLAGGVSNKTVLVRRSSGEAWVLKQALPKLRVQVDWFAPPERIQREAAGLRWLQTLAPEGSVPPLIFEDFDHYLLAMAEVPQPYDNWKQLLLGGHLQGSHIDQFATLLATIHREAFYREDEIRPDFEPSFFEPLRLEPYYAYTASQVSEAATFYEELIEQTRSRRLTLTHGDYSPKNVLVYQDRLILLDHEVMHWGDPCFDLGFSMTHLLSKAHHLPHKRATYASAAEVYFDTYLREVEEEDWAADLEQIAVRHTLGCLLARVAGRSPLEYLDDRQRAIQTDAVVAIIEDPPDDVATIINLFLMHLKRLES